MKRISASEELSAQMLSLILFIGSLRLDDISFKTDSSLLCCYWVVVSRLSEQLLLDLVCFGGLTSRLASLRSLENFAEVIEDVFIASP